MKKFKITSVTDKYGFNHWVIKRRKYFFFWETYNLNFKKKKDAVIFFKNKFMMDYIEI